MAFSHQDYVKYGESETLNVSLQTSEYISLSSSCYSVWFWFRTGVWWKKVRSFWLWTKIDKIVTEAIKGSDASELAALNEQNGRTFTLFCWLWHSGTTCLTIVHTWTNYTISVSLITFFQIWLVIMACLVLLKNTGPMGEHILFKMEMKLVGHNPQG